jgi:adenine-specific DNA-methyltransferase
MAKGRTKNNGGKKDKQVTRYTYEDVKEPRTPETGHTALLPADEQVVTLPMDNGWGKGLQIGRLPETDARPIVVDIDPAVDPLLFWASKRNKRQIPVLPLQRNEIVSESRIAQIIERAQKAAAEKEPRPRQATLFADLEKSLREADKKKRIEFYVHDEGWKNKLICGDSLHVIESLLHYEGLRGKVQTIYIDPPYGISYNSNFQQRVDTPRNNDKDQADDVLTIKAFRDTWALGVHSYLSYLHERLYLCRELLAHTGSIFVQISPENVHHVREVLDEVFGAVNFISQIPFAKTSGSTGEFLGQGVDYLLWYARQREQVKYRALFVDKDEEAVSDGPYAMVELPDGARRRMTREERMDRSLLPKGSRIFRLDNLQSQSIGREKGEGAACWFPVKFEGKEWLPGAQSRWKTNEEGMEKLKANRRLAATSGGLYYVRYIDDFPHYPLKDYWTDTVIAGFASEKRYVVETSTKVVERCVLMTTDPGDLVFDPTCGSGTTAFVAEEWGRRWITCDTSRVAVNVARQRLISSVFPHFKTRNGKVSSGFAYRSASRVTLKSIARAQEPERVDLVDQPEVDASALRVCGPLEVMSLGRYSVEDWKGYVSAAEPLAAYGEPAKLENYIDVICRLYRKGAAVQGASGLVHAVFESQKEKIAISIGPLSGRVTAKQINDAVQDALSSGILEVHVLGWAFEANVGEVKSQLESRGKVKVELIMIRPDTLAEGLKATQPEMLFSPLALPDIDVKVAKKGKNGGEATVKLKGVALFDRKTRTTSYKQADSGYVSAWYLDEDYDGDCFVDCQMFFDFKKAPNLKAALRAEIDAEEYKLQLESRAFPLRGYKRIAVKVVDVYGNESTLVRDLG